MHDSWDSFFLPYSLLLGILCALLFMAILNLCTLRRLKNNFIPAPTTKPFISILIPARNEEHCIEACVRSLATQHYSSLEVLVLDDQSTDMTASIVQQLIDELPPSHKDRIRLLTGHPLPPGWIGKNYACHQLAQYARGDYLFFTDADTIHSPATVDAVITSMHQLNIQLLTAQPEQILGSLGEYLIIPLLNFTILTLLPLLGVQYLPFPSMATGNGQLLCFQKQAYDKIGGHASVKQRILEDVLLARTTKAAGYRMALMDASHLVQCRMYHSFQEVWSGFSKNLFAFYNYSLLFALASCFFNTVLFLLPPAILLFGLFKNIPLDITLCSLASYAIAVLIRVLLTIRFQKHSRLPLLLICLLHPLSITLQCLILCNSIRWHYRKTGVIWKDRHYSHV